MAASVQRTQTTYKDFEALTLRRDELQITLIPAWGGTALRFRFDPTLIPTVGLWLNYGGWAGAPGADPYYIIAIEPCIGVSDRLDVALDAGALLALAGRHRRQGWFVKFGLQSRGSTRGDCDPVLLVTDVCGGVS